MSTKEQMSKSLEKRLIAEAEAEIEKAIAEWKQPENLLSAYKEKNYTEIVLPDMSPAGYRNHKNFMTVFEWLSRNFDRIGKNDRRRLVYMLENHDVLPKGAYRAVLHRDGYGDKK